MVGKSLQTIDSKQQEKNIMGRDLLSKFGVPLNATKTLVRTST